MGGTGASIRAFLSGNNPVKYVDPDGEAQTEGQKRLTEGLSRQALMLSGLAAEKFKDDFSIVISRSYYDNGNNGIYYQSTLNVMYKGKILNTVAVQSTADHPDTVTKHNGKTLPSGRYTGTLLENSLSYLRPIKLVDGVNARQSNAYMFHPNKKTNIVGSVATNKPFSAGCQIPRIDDFDEVMDILESVGFSPGDTIDFVIHDYKPPIIRTRNAVLEYTLVP
jgi:hypothetical protein